MDLMLKIVRVKCFRFGSFASDPSKQPLVTICFYPYPRNVDTKLFTKISWQNIKKNINVVLRDYVWLNLALVSLYCSTLSMDKWPKTIRTTIYSSKALLLKGAQL
jgi:hypothetical protein